MDPKKAALLRVHIAVFVLAMPATLGRLISLDPGAIVFFRTAIAALTLHLFARLLKEKEGAPSLKVELGFALAGLLLAVHWVSFFMATKLTTVPIVLLSASMAPIFVALIEPYLFKERLVFLNLLAAFIGALGVACLNPNLDFGQASTQGILYGLGAAATYATLMLVNRRFAQDWRPTTIMRYESQFAAFWLAPIVLYLQPEPTGSDMIYLLVLGGVCTAFGFSMMVSSLKHLKAVVVNVTVTLCIIYGCLYGYLVLGDVVTSEIWLGGSLIISAVLITNFVPFLQSKRALRTRA